MPRRKEESDVQQRMKAPAASRPRAQRTFFRPWPGYPLWGCSPAEPDSVSPSHGIIAAAHTTQGPAHRIQNRPNAPTGPAPQIPKRRPLLNTQEQDITTD